MSINFIATQALLSCRQAVMASQSASVPGFPYTSVVPIAISQHGQIFSLMNDTAPHTQNILIDARVSLLLHNDLETNWQAATRLSVLGHMQPLRDDSPSFLHARHTFFRIHPDLESLNDSHDAHFWRIEPIRFRLIAGFGRIQWMARIDPELFPLSDDDHQALAHSLRVQGFHAHVIQAGSYGIQILEQGRIRFLALKEPADHLEDLIHQLHAGQFDDPALLD